MRYRLQRHDGTDCSATMVPITVLRMVPIQRYRHSKSQQLVLTYKRGKVQSNDAISYNLDKEYYRDLDLVNQKDPSFEIKKNGI